MDFHQYTVQTTSTLSKCLEKIDRNSRGIAVVVDTSFKCKGVITDGDVRRFLLINPHKDITTVMVQEVMNTDFSFKLVGDDTQCKFSEKVKFFPVLSHDGVLKDVLFDRSHSFWINGKFFSRKSKPLVIAEIGNNHNGCIHRGIRLIDAALASGADFVKFQHRELDDLYAGQGPDDLGSDLATQYTKDLLKKYQLPFEKLELLMDYSLSAGITPLCTPWDFASADKLNSYGLQGFKIASADLTNHPLIEKVADFNKPILLSTGMSTQQEIASTVNLLEQLNASYALLHCNSTYPTPFSHVNMQFLTTLREITNAPLGYSGHERGTHVSAAAVFYGATIIERHLTEDRNLEGADHKASLLQSEFELLVREISNVYEAMGSIGSEREISQGEMINRQNLAKSLICNRSIRRGDVIDRASVVVKSPGLGLQPSFLPNLIGRRAKRDLKSGDFFYKSDLDEDLVELSEIPFKSKIGIPIRYHDYQTLGNLINVRFLEFHLTYKDLDYKISTLQPLDHVDNISVHSPELFDEDHLLNLASLSEVYRSKSIDHLKRTIEVTQNLKDRFSSDKEVVLVVNCGGFTETAFATETEKQKMYEKLSDSLKKLDLTGVVFCAQTMPPFPWLLGGQRFHNCLVLPHEIIKFCGETQIAVCFDSSHTNMAAQYYNFDMVTAFTDMAKFVRHIHIADSLGVDQEGVRLGSGDLDITSFLDAVVGYTPDVGIICETWQGHVDSGRAFIEDLNIISAALASH